MARSPTPGSHDEVQDVAITQLYRQMIERDQAMWKQLNERDRMLQDGMMELFSRMLDNSSVDRVMVAGFTEIAEQLREQLSPLRDLSPPREPLSEEQDALLISLRRALTRPDFSLSPGDISVGAVTPGIGLEGSFAS